MSYMLLVVVGDIDEIATTMPITLRPYSGGKLNAQRNACERKKRESNEIQDQEMEMVKEIDRVPTTFHGLDFLSIMS